MSSSTWVYPTTHQMNPAPHQMNYQDTSSGIITTQPQLSPQIPGIATDAIHSALNGQNGTLSDNTGSRSHSPGTYSFQGPTASAIHSDHNNMYTGEGVAAQSTPTFPNSNSGLTRTSEPRRLLNDSSFSGPRGPLGPSLIQMDYAGVYNADRAQDVQRICCSQCPQRFATHEQFAKHQIKHQKLHRCRISGCSRVEGFTTPNDRDRHEKSVHKTPGMYFRCMDESCASYMKTFARRDNLKDHLKRMHKMPQDMDDMEANERRNELADSWRVDLTPGLTPPPSM
ncbi:hypothetical protein BGX38DRAFT_1166333 [Terfezia claveryi]|nr:hypothetical protein BGX38DRAFT_1166333 [Terfezia claveryi]